MEARERFSLEAMTYLDHLYRVALCLAKEENEAQDLVQETYVRALDSYRQFALGTNIRAWLIKILYNLFFDHYHQKKRWVSVEEKNPGGEEISDYWDRVPGENPGPVGTVRSRLSRGRKLLHKHLRDYVGVKNEE